MKFWENAISLQAGKEFSQNQRFSAKLGFAEWLTEQAGNPLFFGGNMGRKLKQTEHNASIYFQIFDEDIWSMMDKLMSLPKYAKSRTSLINNALSYGLPKLIEAEFGEITLGDENYKQPSEKEVIRITECVYDEHIKEIVRLLQETVLNTSISKALICSLFNAKSDELNGQPTPANKFDNGAMRDTPICMLKYEIDRLNEMDDV